MAGRFIHYPSIH